MSIWDVIGPAGALLIGAVVTWLVLRRRRAAPEPHPSSAKILFPFIGRELSERALQATLRLAWAEEATIVPGYLATVPMRLSLDVSVGKACEEAFEVFEAIEQRAARIGVPVDGRIARGRNVRHALRILMGEVPASRIVVAAASSGRRDGFSVDDVAWLLRNAPAEVVVLRPDPRTAAGSLRAEDDPLLRAEGALRRTDGARDSDLAAV